MQSTRTRQLGINLVELLVTISIATLSLTVGVPAFEGLRIRSDRTSAIIELVSAARLARSEAALRGIPVSLCPSTDGSSCSGEDDWSNGWIVFHDQDRDLTIDDQTEVLKVVRFEHPLFVIAADDRIGAGITFGLFGFADPASGAFAYSDAQAARTLQLTYIGRLNVIEPAPESSE